MVSPQSQKEIEQEERLRIIDTKAIRWKICQSFSATIKRDGMRLQIIKWHLGLADGFKYHFHKKISNNIW